MRAFYLENSAAERKDLNGDGSENVYLIHVAGLGVTLSPAFADLRKGFFSKVSGDIEPLQEILGDLIFHNTSTDPYIDYQTIVDWLAEDETFYLVYKPYSTTEYYREIEVNFLSKGEKDVSHLLTVPVSFVCKTPWYTSSPTETSIVHSTLTYKQYNFTYDYTYPAATQYATVNVSATGHIPAAYTLEYTGSLSTPSIILTGVTSGTVYSQCDISESIALTDTFYYSCKYGDSYVKKVTAAGVETDLLDYVDITNEPYGRIPTSETCQLKLTSTQSINADADIDIYNYYRSV